MCFVMQAIEVALADWELPRRSSGLVGPRRGELAITIVFARAMWRVDASIKLIGVTSYLDMAGGASRPRCLVIGGAALGPRRRPA